MIRSRSTALRIPRGRRNALQMRAVLASAAEPPRRDTMRDQSWFNSESAFMSPLNRQRFQRSRGYFSAYGAASDGSRGAFGTPGLAGTGPAAQSPFNLC